MADIMDSNETATAPTTAPSSDPTTPPSTAPTPTFNEGVFLAPPASSSDQSPISLPCYKCKSPNHTSQKCYKKFNPCKICGLNNHHQTNCHRIKGCVKNPDCKKKHHYNLDCSLPECGRCKLLSHSTPECCEEQCESCGKFDHSTKRCIKCNRCNKMGHKSKFCKEVIERVKYCKLCKIHDAHWTKDCKNAYCKFCSVPGHVDYDREKCPNYIYNNKYKQ